MRVFLLLSLAAPFASAEPAGPSEDGPMPVASRKVSVPDASPNASLDAVIFYPGAEAGDSAPPADGGPWPACVFSPGGPAPSAQGYDDFAKRFASWGVVTLVVAFGDRPADKRAPQFLAARDWLEKQNADKNWFLSGKLDARTFLAAGHSRGGAAAMLAAADPKKWAGCVAVGPALQAPPAKYATPTFLIGSPEDKTLKPLFDGQKKPRWKVVVAGMDHFLNPTAGQSGDKRETTVAYCAAWVGVRYLAKKEWKGWLAGEKGKKDVKDGVLAECVAEE